MENNNYFFHNIPHTQNFYNPKTYQTPFTKSMTYTNNFCAEPQLSSGRILQKYIQESYDAEGNRIITTKIIRELNNPSNIKNNNKVIYHSKCSSFYNNKKYQFPPCTSPIIVQEKNFQESPYFNQENFDDNKYNRYTYISKIDRNVGSPQSIDISSDYINNQSDFIDSRKNNDIYKSYRKTNQKNIIFENDDSDFNDYVKHEKIKNFGKNTMKNIQTNKMTKSIKINNQKKDFDKKDFQTPDRGNAKNMSFKEIKVTSLKSNGPTCNDMKITRKMRNQINKEESLTKSNNNFEIKINSAKIIQNWWRNIVDRNEVFNIIVKKATKLQSFIRGFLVRKKVLRYVTLAIYYHSFCDKLQDVLCIHAKNEVFKLFKKKFSEKENIKIKNSKKLLNNKNNGKIKLQINQNGKNLLKKIILNKANIFKKINTNKYFSIWKNIVYPSALKRVIINKILKERNLKLNSFFKKWKLVSSKIKKQIYDIKKYFYKTNVNISREIRSRSVCRSLRNNINLSSSNSPSPYKNIFSSNQKNFTLTPIKINNNRPYDLFKSPAATKHFYGGEVSVHFIKNRKYKEIIYTKGNGKHKMDITPKKNIKKNKFKNGQYKNKTNNIRVISNNFDNNNLSNLNIINSSNYNSTIRNKKLFSTINKSQIFSSSNDREIKNIKIINKYCPIHGWFCPVHGLKKCSINRNSNMHYKKSIKTRNINRSLDNIFDENQNLNTEKYDFYKIYSFNDNAPKFNDKTTNSSMSITFGNKGINEKIFLKKYNNKNYIDNQISVNIMKLPEKKQKTDNKIKTEEVKMKKIEKKNIDVVKEETNKLKLIDKGVNQHLKDNEIYKLAQINFYGSKPEMLDISTQKNDYFNYMNKTKSSNAIKDINNDLKNNDNNYGMNEEDIERYHSLLENVEKNRLEKIYNKLKAIVIKQMYNDLLNERNIFNRWKNIILTNKNKNDKIKMLLSKLIYKKIMGDKLRLCNALRKWVSSTKNNNLNLKNKKTNFSQEKNQNWNIIEKNPNPVKVNQKENVKNQLKHESVMVDFVHKFKEKDFAERKKSFEIKSKNEKKTKIIKPSFKENQICLFSQNYIFEQECIDGKHHPITEETWKKILQILLKIFYKKDNTNSILDRYLNLWLKNVKLLKCCQNAEKIQEFCKQIAQDKISNKWRKLAKKYILRQRLNILRLKKVIDTKKKKLLHLMKVTRSNLIFSRNKFLHYVILCWKIYTINIINKRRSIKIIYENMLKTYMNMADDMFGSNKKENPSVQDALFEAVNSNKFQVNNIKDVPIAEIYYSQKKEEIKIDNNNIPYFLEKEAEVKTYEIYKELLKNQSLSQFDEEIKDNRNLIRKNMQISTKSPENINVFVNKKVTKMEKIEEEISTKNIDNGNKQKINIEYSSENNQQKKQTIIEEISTSVSKNNIINKPKTEVLIEKEVNVEKPTYQKTDLKSGGENLLIKKEIEISKNELEESKKINIFNKSKVSPQAVDNKNIIENIGIKVEETKVYPQKEKEKSEITEKMEEKDKIIRKNKAGKLYRSKRMKGNVSSSSSSNTQ